MLEKRHIPRRRVLKAGAIHFGRAGTIDCTVRNLSDDGAMLQVESPVGVPDAFVLVIPGDGVKRECAVAWRSLKQIGVTFR